MESLSEDFEESFRSLKEGEGRKKYDEKYEEDRSMDEYSKEEY